MLHERSVKLISLRHTAHVTLARGIIMHISIEAVLPSLQLEAGEEATKGRHLECLDLLAKL